MPSETLCVPALILRILTSTSSPVFKTSDGLPMRFQEMSPTCSKPSMPPEVDKRAEVGQVANFALQNRTFLQRGKGFPFCGFLFLFKNAAAVDDNVFLGGIELDDLALDLLADQLFHLGLVARAAARSRHEGGNADIDAETALHQFVDRALDRQLSGEGGLERRPVLGPFHTNGGEDV